MFLHSLFLNPSGGYQFNFLNETARTALVKKMQRNMLRNYGIYINENLMQQFKHLM